MRTQIIYLVCEELGLRFDPQSQCRSASSVVIQKECDSRQTRYSAGWGDGCSKCNKGLPVSHSHSQGLRIEQMTNVWTVLADSDWWTPRIWLRIRQCLMDVCPHGQVCVYPNYRVPDQRWWSWKQLAQSPGGCTQLNSRLVSCSRLDLKHPAT